MSYFYKDRFDFYYKVYWENEPNSIVIPNGFIDYPNKEYNYFVNIIANLNTKNKCSVMDIGCGNGLLLKHIMEHYHLKVIPFGLDFLMPSIEQATKIIHPNYSQNFFISNAIDFDFTQLFFDFVLLDPYHFTNNDLIALLQTLIQQTSNSIIFYTYNDVLKHNNFKNVAEFSALKSINNLQIFNYEEISFAILVVK